MRSLVLVWCVACGSSSPTPVKPPSPPAPDASVAVVTPPIVKHEDWAGTLAAVHELRDIVVHFTSTDGTWTATMDVPIAKLANKPLTSVTMSADAITFTLGSNELYAFKRNGDVAEGMLAVSGTTMYAKLVKLAPGEVPRTVIGRPQTPKPPFPYTSREVEFPAPEDGTVAGTLTIPEGKGPFPAILLVSGSGQQDRDETIFGHKPFAVIADRLTRDGIAVLRTDDRATGKTKGVPTSLETDFGDNRAAFEFLIKQPEIDPKRVGILGHSVGGLIAPTIAARGSKVAFIVSEAGPGIRGAELVPMQLEISLTAKNLPAPVIKAIVDGQRAVGAAVVKGDEAGIRAALKQTAIDTAAATGAPRPTDDQLEAEITAKYKTLVNPWVSQFFKTDPAAAWKKFKGPVLAVNGDKDTQVPADLNLSKIAAAVRAGGNKDVRTEKRPGLNHLFQHAATGLLEEYGMIEETFDPATLDLIAKWVVDKTTRKR